MTSRNHNRAVVVTYITRQTFSDQGLGRPAPLEGSWEEEFLLKDYPTPWAFLNAIAKVFIKEGTPFNHEMHTTRTDRNQQTRLIHTKVMGFRDTDPEIVRIVCAITNANVISLR